MTELTIEQATQRFHELNFVAKHHEDLSKNYLREAVILEQAIIKAQAEVDAAEKATLEPANPDESPEEV